MQGPIDTAAGYDWNTEVDNAMARIQMYPRELETLVGRSGGGQVNKREEHAAAGGVGWLQLLFGVKPTEYKID